MPWFRLEDSFHSHPKVIAAGNEAAGLFVRCGTYAAEHLTDGFIRQDVALLYGSAELAGTLVRAGLWNRTRGGWQIHDYLDYNPSAEQVKQERKQAAERQRRRRDRIPSRRDSRGYSRRESHDPDPARNYPPTPEPGGSGEHLGQHKHCRQCGTNPRGEPPPTPLPPPYQPPNGRGRVPSEDVADLLASTRHAITKEAPDDA